MKYYKNKWVIQSFGIFAKLSAIKCSETEQSKTIQQGVKHVGHAWRDCILENNITTKGRGEGYGR